PGPFDNFGWSVSVSGDTVFAGVQQDDYLGQNSGSAYVFERISSGTWTDQKLFDSRQDTFLGFSVSVSGDTAVVGAPYEDNAGAAYVFVRSAGTWTEQQKL